MSDCSLYLVSPPKLDLRSCMPQLREALAYPCVKAFQLRLKEASDAEILEAAKEILPLAREKDIPFILNDRADLAAKCGADGLHLGQEDMSFNEAKSIVGGACVIGITCHASRDLGMTAAEEGADYVAFGAFYPTTSKPKEKLEKWGTPTPDLLDWWSVHVTTPCVAIGGITPANCKPLIDAGADFLAVITAVWDHPQGAGAGVKAFAEVLKGDDRMIG